MRNVWIGTSGWTYKHWRGRFYPHGLTQRKWLEFYAGRFTTVELNASFYRIPKPTTARGWVERTPDDFRFSIKVSRLITHVRKLRNCEGELSWFFGDTESMDAKVAVYLFQFPPFFVPDAVLLDDFFMRLPEGKTYVCEFRNPKAYTDEFVSKLEEWGVGFCIHDFPERESPTLVSSSTVYLRFHGYGIKYGGCYPDSVLAGWAEKISGWVDEGRGVFAYFNNDCDGYAIQNATTLKTMLST